MAERKGEEMIYLQLFLSFLKIGLFGFGGGLAIFSLIQHEIEVHGWMTQEEFVDILAVSQVTPGPIGINCATYVGYTATGNVWGSLLATTAIIIPSLIIMLSICKVYFVISTRFQRNIYFTRTMHMLRLAVLGMIGAAALLLMKPINSFCEIKVALGSRKLERFNQNMCATFTVMPKQGASTGNIMDRIEAITAKEFSNSYAVSWTDMSYQEKNNDGRLIVLMMLAVLFSYLFLVAQYESWTVPIPVILSVSFAGLGGAIALFVKGLLMDIYAQLGLIMLIGLCAKSTILMVEFSMQERKIGKSVARSALNGANYRYRAVLMTAWSFIIGVLPLLFASGAGAESRKIIGITSFWGMVCATFLGVAFIPPMYVIFQKMREKVNGKKG